MSLRVIHVIPGVWEHTGGPAEVVPRLCQGLVAKGCKVTLMTLDGRHSQSALASMRAGVDLRSYPVLGRFGLWYSPALAKDLAVMSPSADIIHIHGMWLYPNWIAGNVALSHKTPFIVTPHGLLGFSHRRRSRLKKALAWHMCDKHYIRRASCIHLFSRFEVPAVRSLRITAPIGVIPNGVDIWSLPEPCNFVQRYPELANKKLVLFLGRVHPTKGIYDLIDAWAELAVKYTDWHLVIVGNIEQRESRSINNAIEKNRLRRHLTVAGPQYDDARLEAYAAADVFVLPSYAEGFPVSLLEALACSIPVVYTSACNFPEASQCGAGYTYDAGVDGLVTHLHRILCLDDSERREMGRQGHKLIVDRYSWDIVTTEMLSLYEWLLGSSEPPPHIQF